jgi:hypothetical protein
MDGKHGLRYSKKDRRRPYRMTETKGYKTGRPPGKETGIKDIISQFGRQQLLIFEVFLGLHRKREGKDKHTVRRYDP